jgi:hypothetical protein
MEAAPENFLRGTTRPKNHPRFIEPLHRQTPIRRRKQRQRQQRILCSENYASLGTAKSQIHHASVSSSGRENIVRRGFIEQADFDKLRGLVTELWLRLF